MITSPFVSENIFGMKSTDMSLCIWRYFTHFYCGGGGEWQNQNFGMLNGLLTTLSMVSWLMGQFQHIHLYLWLFFFFCMFLGTCIYSSWTRMEMKSSYFSKNTLWPNKGRGIMTTWLVAGPFIGLERCITLGYWHRVFSDCLSHGLCRGLVFNYEQR